MNRKYRPSLLRRIRVAIVRPFELIAERCIRVLQGIERFMGRLGSNLGRIAGGIGQAILPAGIIKSVRKGFVRGGRVAQVVGQYILPWKLLTRLSRSMDKLWNWAWWLATRVAAVIVAIYNRVVPRAFRRWLKQLFVPVWQAGAAVVGFGRAWFRSRDYRRLLGALPAFLLLLPIVACLGKAQITGSQAKIRHYRQAALDALEDEDFATADLCYRKLAQLGQSQRVEFEAALAKAAEGDLETAYISVRKLAPDDETGYPPAHFWIAQQLVQGNLDVSDEERWELAEKHVQHVLSRNPRDRGAQWLEASLLASSGKSQEAISKMEQLVHQLPTLRLRLAQLYMQQGRPIEAFAEARRLLRFYDQERDAKQALQPNEYVVWASTALALGQLELAREVVDKGLAATPENEELATVSMRVYLASYNRARRLGVELEQRIGLLGQALRIAPADENVLRQVAELARELGVTHVSFQAMVRPVVEGGGQSGSPTADDGNEEEGAGGTFELVDTLGFIAHEQETYELALEYFERQHEQHPENPSAANNLAYAMQFVSPTDLNRAFQLADQAVRAEPEDPAYRETRGQLLVQLQRWGEAVEDLEMAVNAMPGQLEIHGALAKAYSALGHEELAELHRRQAK